MMVGTMRVRRKQRQLLEEGEGDWIGRVRLMESGGEWGRVGKIDRREESEGKCRGRVMAEREGKCTGRE